MEMRLTAAFGGSIHYPEAMYWAGLGSIPYWIAFVGAFLAVAIWESVRPLRRLRSEASRRWRNHGSLFAVSMVCTGLALRVSPVVVAFASGESSYGRFVRAF